MGSDFLLLITVTETSKSLSFSAPILLLRLSKALIHQNVWSETVQIMGPRRSQLFAAGRSIMTKTKTTITLASVRKDPQEGTMDTPQARFLAAMAVLRFPGMLAVTQ